MKMPLAAEGDVKTCDKVEIKCDSHYQVQILKTQLSSDFTHCVEWWIGFLRISTHKVNIKRDAHQQVEFLKIQLSSDVTQCTE